jgi:Mn2+/Fe2+ NRAMP family transporter
MERNLQQSIPLPPAGIEKLKWIGPGFLWMVSAAGSGELLFTPRVGALYGYALLWALLFAVILKWYINREIGRYTVCTGKTVMDGFAQLGKNNWAVYVILLPQLVVAVATIAGLAGSAGTALVLLLPGDIRIWTIVSIVISTALVVWGRYNAVELVATILAVALSVSAIIAALTVFPNMNALVQGLIPQVPANINYGEILPWLGFMLSGAAGMIWYSYWIQRRGYGAVANKDLTYAAHYSAEDTRRLKGWIKQMTFDNNVAVFGTLLMTLSFLILGVELLRPAGLVPEENRVAEVLGQLLGRLWGPIGFWFMVVGVFIGFWDTVLSDQDGFGRMFAGGTRLLLQPFGTKGKWVNEGFLKNFYVIVIVTILPIILYLTVGKPVMLLKLAGFIEAAHIPVLTALVMTLNQRHLPEALRPSSFTRFMMLLAGLFFGLFAVIYLLQISGWLQL